MKRCRQLAFWATFLLIAQVFAQAQPTPAPTTPPASQSPRVIEPPRGGIMVDDVETRKLLMAEEPKIKQRIERIDAELKAMDRNSLKDGEWAKEWAGRYYEGDGMGENVNIHLAPKSGIAYLNYGCTGLYGGDHGDVVEALSDGLKITLVIGKPGGSFLSERMYFVKWGERRYLVPDWAMLKLVNNYNEGGLGRDMMIGIPRLEREGKQNPRFDDPPAVGRPELPAEFAKLLHDAPIELKVTNVTPVVRRQVTTGVVSHRCTVEFDGGAEQGVYLGLKFRYPISLTMMTGMVEITQVNATTSTGCLVVYCGEDGDPRPPVVGEVLITSEVLIEPAASSQPEGVKNQSGQDGAKSPGQP